MNCPNCNSTNVATERRPDGDHICLDCHTSWPISRLEKIKAYAERLLEAQSAYAGVTKIGEGRWSSPNLKALQTREIVFAAFAAGAEFGFKEAYRRDLGLFSRNILGVDPAMPGADVTKVTGKCPKCNEICEVKASEWVEDQGHLTCPCGVSATINTKEYEAPNGN